MTTILHKRGTGRPAANDLSVGEIALDTSTGTAYTKLSNDTVVEIGGSGDGGGSGGGDSGGGSGSTLTATASGAINAGDPVVSSGEEVVSAVVSQMVDGEFKSLSDWGESGSALPNLIYSQSKNRLVLFYKNSEQRGVAIVGKIEGDTVSFGTPVIFQSPPVDFMVAIECEDVDRFAVQTAYSGTGKAYVAAVYDMSIRFGTSPANAGLNVQGICYDQKNQAVVVGGISSARVRCQSWRFKLSESGIDGDVLEEIRGYDVSDNAASGVRLSLCNRSGNVLFLYSETSGRGVARAVSFEDVNNPQKGSEEIFASSIADEDIDCSYHNAEGVVVVNYRDSGYDASAIVARLDGLKIEFGQPAEVLTVLGSRQTDGMRSVYDPATNNVLFMYRNRNRNYHCYGINGKVDGLSISFDSDDSAYVLVSNSANSYSPVYVGSADSPLTFASHIYTTSKRHVMLFSNSYEKTNLSETNYIGISSSDALDGEDVTVDISGGVNAYQKDLLFGERYYVSHNGDLTASAVDSPLYPEVFAGTAISSQKIIVKG